MSEVVQLNSRKKRELDVWQCRCGSYAFWLYSDGSVVCLDCKQEARTMHGYWRVPAPDADERNKNNIHQLRPGRESSDH